MPLRHRFWFSGLLHVCTPSACTHQQATLSYALPTGYDVLTVVEETSLTHPFNGSNASALSERGIGAKIGTPFPEVAFHCLLSFAVCRMKTLYRTSADRVEKERVSDHGHFSWAIPMFAEPV